MEWKEVSEIENYNFNCFIREVDESCQVDLFPDQLKEHEKAFPYNGFAWRDLNFVKRFTVGECNFSVGGEMVKVVGFLSTNIYRYKEWNVTYEERERTVVMLREMMEAWPNIDDINRAEMLKRFFNLMQGLTTNRK